MGSSKDGGTRLFSVLPSDFGKGHNEIQEISLKSKKKTLSVPIVFNSELFSSFLVIILEESTSVSRGDILRNQICTVYLSLTDYDQPFRTREGLDTLGMSCGFKLLPYQIKQFC